jgi:hypothetical protein
VLLEPRGGCGTRGLWPLKQSSPTSPRASAMLGALDGSSSVVTQRPALVRRRKYQWCDGHPRISLHFIRATKNTGPVSRSSIGSQPCLQANTRAASSPTKIQRIKNHYRLHHHGHAPVESAEHRRKARGSRRGLFECWPERSARVPQPPRLSRSAGNL